MPRFPRLDPDYPHGEMLATKVRPADAARIIELANESGLSKSALVRTAVLDFLESRDNSPPDEGG